MPDSNVNGNERTDLIKRPELIGRLVKSVMAEDGCSSGQGAPEARNILLAGPWGSGKTTILNDLKKEEKVKEIFHIITFAPNALAVGSDPRVALLGVLGAYFSSVKEEDLKEKGVFSRVKESVRNVNIGNVANILKKVALHVAGETLGVVGKAAVGAVVGAAEGMAESVGESLDFSDEQGEFSSILKALLAKGFEDESVEDPEQTTQDRIRRLIQAALTGIAALNDKQKVLLLVDDLDRTRPEEAIRFLDSMYRLIMPEEDGCNSDWPLTTVWAVHTAVLGEYLYREYREVPSFEPMAYLEKMFHHRVYVGPLLAYGLPEEEMGNNSIQLWKSAGFNEEESKQLSVALSFPMLGNLRFHKKLRTALYSFRQQSGNVKNINSLILYGRILFISMSFGHFREKIIVAPILWERFVKYINERDASGGIESIKNPLYGDIEKDDLIGVLVKLAVIEKRPVNGKLCYYTDNDRLKVVRKCIGEMARYGF